MASINFKGKNSVWNHHLSVPYQILEKDKKLSLKGENEDENLIIEADNLIALKSLLPRYQGKIKCIYIDPPYNNGNEGWIYNDKVNSPLIKEWLKKTVDREDLTRHDKWLCMMTPRLKLLRDLLSNDGVIFISIDDNEFHRLRQLMDEIFEEDNFVGVMKWKKKKQPSFLHGQLSSITEYIMVFAKNIKQLGKLSLEKIAGDTKPLFNANNKEVIRFFPKGIRVNFKEGKIPKGRIQIRTSVLEYLDDVFVKRGRTINKFRLKARFRDGQENINQHSKEDLIFITSNRTLRRNVSEEESKKQKTITDLLLDWGQNQDAFDELYNIFDKEVFFENPKPSLLIKNLAKSSTSSNDIILDSFAGSGTTAHAVLTLNKEDNGNRKFILVQLPEKIKKDTPAYNAGFRSVHEITRERVKRVIKKDKLEVGFSYMKLGLKIDADSILSGTLPSYKEFAKYVYYLATGKTMENEKTIKEEKYFVGKTGNESIYLIYKKDFEKLKGLAITLNWAEKINKTDKGKKIVYAPSCFLDDEYLEKFNIHFVSLPYNLFEKK